MERWLSDLVFVALAEDLGSIPSTHMVALQPSVTPVPGESGAHDVYLEHAGKILIK